MNRWVEGDLKAMQEYIATLEDWKKKGNAERDFFTAAQRARLSVFDDSLLAFRNDEGDLCYSDWQGNKAACLTREDVVGIAGVQLAILKRLDRNKNYMIGALVILFYIAARLS